jgi:hypothetical protein
MPVKTVPVETAPALIVRLYDMPLLRIEFASVVLTVKANVPVEAQVPERTPLDDSVIEPEQTEPEVIA